MDQDLVIQTNRLRLFTVLPNEYEVLAKDQADPKLWLDRGFSDPDKHFLANQKQKKLFSLLKTLNSDLKILITDYISSTLAKKLVNLLELWVEVALENRHY